MARSRYSLPALLLAAPLLAACAGAAGGPDARAVANAHDGSVVASVLGTPFYALGKGGLCLLNAVLGSASSVALEATDRADKEYQRAALHEGIGESCRGPYYLPGAY